VIPGHTDLQPRLAYTVHDDVLGVVVVTWGHRRAVYQ